MRVDLLTREYPPHVYGGAGVHVAGLTARAATARSTCGCTASTARATPPGVRRATRCPAELAGRERRAADVRRSTSRWPTRSDGRCRRRRVGPGALPHLVRQPGRATWRVCCTACRTWSARTASSRCAPGRPSSSAAATRCRSWAERTAYEGAAARHRGRGGHARRTSCGPTRRSTRRGSRGAQRHRPRPAGGGPTGDDGAWPPRAPPCAGSASTRIAPGRRVRRPDHPAEGPALLPARRRAAAARRSRSCCARARRTRPQIMAEVTRARRAAAQPSGPAWSGSSRCSRATSSSRSSCTARSSRARRSTSRSASSTSRPWRSGCPWSGRRPAASPRSSTTASPACSCPSTSLQDGTGTPVDPDRFVADLADALTDVVGHRPGARPRWGLARRRRVEDHFAWEAIAERTIEVYRRAVAGLDRPGGSAATGRRSPRHRAAGHPVDLAQRGGPLVGLPQVDRAAVVLRGQRDDRPQARRAGQHAQRAGRRAVAAAATRGSSSAQPRDRVGRVRRASGRRRAGRAPRSR